MPFKFTRELREGDIVKLKNAIGWKTLSADPLPHQSTFILVDTMGMHYLARNELHEVLDA